MHSVELGRSSDRVPSVARLGHHALCGVVCGLRHGSFIGPHARLLGTEKLWRPLSLMHPQPTACCMSRSSSPSSRGRRRRSSFASWDLGALSLPRPGQVSLQCEGLRGRASLLSSIGPTVAAAPASSDPHCWRCWTPRRVLPVDHNAAQRVITEGEYNARTTQLLKIEIQWSPLARRLAPFPCVQQVSYRSSLSPPDGQANRLAGLSSSVHPITNRPGQRVSIL